MINYTSNEKALIVYLTVGLIKQILLYTMSYITDVNIFEFAKKADLVSLKSDIDKLDADKVDMIN